jgi:uncharacterized protein YbjT (DUF2867 family)
MDGLRTSSFTQSMNVSSTTHTTLVIGGTGKTGRRVVERLVARGLPHRVGSRAGTPPFEWNEESTWGPALEDMTAAYVVYYPDLAFPGAAESVTSFFEIAVRKGVGRLVLLSGRGEEEAQVSERALQDSGADWTILQSARLAAGVQRALAREPRDFRAYARATAASGVWNVVEEAKR